MAMMFTDQQHVRMFAFASGLQLLAAMIVGAGAYGSCGVVSRGTDS